MEYSQLKITNQFMFGKIMQDPKICKQMLDYFDGKEPSDEFTSQLEDAVIKARNNKEWRVEYMTLTLRDQDNILKGRAEGRAEGKIEGRIEGRIEAIKKLLARGDSESSILELDYTLEEIQQAKTSK